MYIYIKSYSITATCLSLVLFQFIHIHFYHVFCILNCYCKSLYINLLHLLRLYKTFYLQEIEEVLFCPCVSHIWISVLWLWFWLNYKVHHPKLRQQEWKPVSQRYDFSILCIFWFSQKNKVFNIRIKRNIKNHLIS